MNVTLGPRLRAIANHVPIGSRIADIGSDHGYLPAWLLLNQRVSKAIAGEVNQDPARRALVTCQEYDLQPEMSVRIGDGLQILQPGEVDVIVISGMGGITIRSILERGRAVLAGSEKLILQPNVASADLRRWLAANQYVIFAESLVEEGGIIYEVIVAELGEAFVLSELEALLGPVLLRERPPLFLRRVEQLVAEREYILRQLARSLSPAAEQKQTRLRREIVELRALAR